ncbi:MAG: histidine phosphatase family protein [bacterium]|nr:histidine phosphatase family protein [bacterium]
MTSVVLVPWGLTEWGLSGRLATRTPLPLNKAGLEQATQWAKEMAGRELAAVYCGDEPTSRQTADLLARCAEVRLRPSEELKEVDVGLWEGLTHAQVESRFPKLFRRWIEDPAAVCPPQGECVSDAANRVGPAVEQVLRKHKNQAVALVLGPITLAMARCHLEHDGPSRMHELMSAEPVWYRITDDRPAPAPAPATT